MYTMYCKTGKNQRLNPNVLRREAFLVVFLTLFGLFLGAVLGSTCIIILKLNGFNYFPASFGKISLPWTPLYLEAIDENLEGKIVTK